ncbi:HlyD family type I secretion periplasmic adaptor subunit [Magnetococcales bacterium HHB-1]
MFNKVSKVQASDKVDDDQVQISVHLFFSLLALTCLAFAGWAYYGTLDILSMAQGEVVPFSQVKKVQHLEGGIISKIWVSEGDRVQQGETLVELEAAASRADVNELNARIASLTMAVLRLEAEAADKKTLVIPANLETKFQQRAQQVIMLFNARRKRLHDDQLVHQTLITQRQQDISEIRGRLKSQNQQLKLVREQLRISENLLKDDLTNRYNHLNLLKESNNIKGNLASDRTALLRAKAALKEAETRLLGVRNAYDEEVKTGLEKARRELGEYSARLGKYADNLSRTVVKSPVSGVVHNIHIVTKGGVVKPGETIMDLVPGNDRLIIEAKLPIGDIGYIQIGQRSVIKLVQEAARFGDIYGEVVAISPDTLLNDDGIPFYKVRIETEAKAFQKGENRYRLYPGMLVMVQIHTGNRSVMAYLFASFLESLDDAMSER